MKVYNSDKTEKEACVLALGSFDTIHLGHRKLIDIAVEYGHRNSISAGVYMFASRPAHMLNKDALKDVYTAVQRERFFEQLGVDFVYYENFDAEFMQKTPEEFVAYLIEKLEVRAVVVGFNYRFGKNAAGDGVLLKQLCALYDVEVIVVPEVCDKTGSTISSTKIRHLLAQGNLEDVNALLGRYYAMEGKVKKDRGIGRSLGFPTANILPDPKIAVPGNGVYATVVCVDDNIYPAITNIGVRPTYGLHMQVIESHLLQFNGDLYEKSIQVCFLKKMRDERAFADEIALKMQIQSDKNEAEAYFSKINLETFQNRLEKRVEM